MKSISASLLFGFLLFVTDLSAQVTTSNLQGTITDAASALVTDAKVKAKNLDTGEERSTSTNADGFYRFNLLPRGQYQVQAEKAGFATATANVTLTVGQTLTANISLQLPAKTEQVVVTGEATRVDTASSQIQTAVLQTQIVNLPINDRNFQQLANLIPGAAPSPSYDPTKRLYGGVVAAGGTARSSGVSIDGGNFNDNIVGGPVGLVPEDAIQEFQVVTNQLSAEYGHSEGPFINVVTKSGTNKVHGSGFSLFRHKDLQAHSFFEQVKPDFDREQFGGSLGGPIIVDRTFGFFAIERNRQEKSQTVNTGGIYPQLEGSFPAPFRDLLMVAKFDHRFNASHNLSFRSSFQRNTSREGLRIDPNIAVGGPPTESAFQTATNENISWQAMHNWLISSRTLNAFMLHFNRFINNLVPTSNGINLRFPSVVLGQNASTPQGVQQDRLQLRDDLSTIAGWHGVHNLKFGADLNPRIKYNGLFDLFKNGIFVFDQDDPSVQCTPDFINPVSCTTAVSPIFALKGLGSTVESGTTVWQVGYYAQDDWKVSSRLTLNLGLRYEYESGFINAGTRHPLEGQAPFFDSRTRETPKLNFGPRVGFAYDVLGNGHSVIRGGFGIYYDSTPWEISYIDRTFNGVKYLFGFFNPAQATLSDPAFSAPQTPGGFAIDGKVKQPYAEHFSIGLGQQLPYGVVLDASYVHTLALHGWMTRELNPGAAVFPTLGLFSSFQTTNISHYNALQLSARKRLEKRVQFQVSYTLSKAVSLSDDIFEPGVPQDSNNIFADKGPTLRDARHRFVVSGIVELPWGFQTSNIVSLQSGRPFNITTGSDDNGDGHVKDRPAGVGRNAGRAAPTYVWDTRLTRPFKIGERITVAPSLDVFNLPNHPNFDAESYVGALNAGCDPTNPAPCGTLQIPGPQFGRPTDVNSPPRQLQIGVRVTF